MISNRECHDGLGNERERQEYEKRELHDRVVGYKFGGFQRLLLGLWRMWKLYCNDLSKLKVDQKESNYSMYAR